MTLWRLERAGRFPRRVKLGPNSVGWLANEIDDWISERVAQRDARTPARANRLAAADAECGE